MNTEITLHFQARLLKIIGSLIDERRLMTESEVADIFGVDVCTVRRWRKDELIGHYLLEGGDVRYSWAQVNERMQSRERPSKDEARRRRALNPMQKQQAKA